MNRPSRTKAKSNHFYVFFSYQLCFKIFALEKQGLSESWQSNIIAVFLGRISNDSAGKYDRAKREVNKDLSFPTVNLLSLALQSQAELSALKQKQEQERKDEVLENVATVLLEYDGTGSDQELVKALDQKYDALKDKLLLEALKKQLGMSSSDRYLFSSQKETRTQAFNL